MRKVLVKVKDNGCFYDMNHKGQTAMNDRPYILEVSSFVNMAVAQGRLEILGDVKEDCTDENFLKFYKNEKDKKAAVTKFLKGKSSVKIEDENPAKTQNNDPEKTQGNNEPEKAQGNGQPEKAQGNNNPAK